MMLTRVRDYVMCNVYWNKSFGLKFIDKLRAIFVVRVAFVRAAP